MQSDQYSSPFLHPTILPELDENTTPDLENSSVNMIHGWRYGLLWICLFMVRIWTATLRVSVRWVGSERADSENLPRPAVILVWHNRLIVGPLLRYRFVGDRKVCGLISASRDGAWVAALSKIINMRVIRGSSSQRQLAVARKAIKELRMGNDIAITPDGPRGPCYGFKKGAAVFARLANCPILMLCPNFSSATRLKSWDGFYLPAPFSKVEIMMRLIPSYKELGVESEKEGAEKLRQLFLEITNDN